MECQETSNHGRSSAAAEHRSMVATATELTWVSFLLRDLSIPLHCAPVLHCGNMSALYMKINPILHAWTKHIELDYHYICERVALGYLENRFVTSANQLAGIYTKPLPKALFHIFCRKLDLCLDPQPCLKGSESSTTTSVEKITQHRHPGYIKMQENISHHEEDITHQDLEN